MARTQEVSRQQRRSGSQLWLGVLVATLLAVVAMSAVWYVRGELGQWRDLAGQVERVATAVQTEAGTRLAAFQELVQRIESLRSAIDQLTAAQERLEAFVSRLSEQIAQLEERGAQNAAVPAAAQPVAAHPAPPAPEAPEPAAAEARESVILYRVRAGETLWDIAGSLTGSALNYPVLMEYNGLDSPPRLRAGQILRIPVQYLAESEAPGAPR